MRDGRRLPYPWLRNLRLIPPLFEAGDKVRILWEGAVRVCFPDHRYTRWIRPDSEKIYTVNNVEFFSGRTGNLSGYKVELAERKAWWFWAYGFIKAEFTGWVALASALRLMNERFFKGGADYSALWRVPCGLCHSPMKWRLPENGPECRCGVCRYLPSQVKWAREVMRLKEAVSATIDGLEDFLRSFGKIAPGKLVRPIGPAVFPVILEKDIFDEPLDSNQEYVVKDFLKGDSSKVLLMHQPGAYNIKFFQAV